MIRDFIGRDIETGVLFEGTYGIEIEAESLKKQPFKMGHGDVDKDSFTFWDVKKDDSLRNYGNEFVLKAPVPYETIPEVLEEFAEKTKKISFIQDSISTSVHVHINMLPETWTTMGNLLTIYMFVENLLIEYSGEYRRNNLFCLPIRSVPHIQKVCNTIFQFVNEKNYNFRRALDVEQIKYAALNLSTLYRFGSVEFRSFRGVTDIDVIKTWVDIVHAMLVYSRQNITPPVIMDAYKERGNELLREIFGSAWKYLDHPDKEKLLRSNLWYASTLAYSLTEDEWVKLNEKPAKPDLDDETLNKIALKIYGDIYYVLDSDCQATVQLIAEQEMSAKKKKIKKVNLYEIVESWETAPQPSVVNFDSEEVNF